MKRNVRILLCGYYFQGNTGDDLMMESIRDSLSKYGEVRVISTETLDTGLLDWCQLLVIGAGSLITSRGIGGYEHAKYAKEKGKKVVYYSQTIEEGHPQFKEHLARADLITVRDPVSKKVEETHGFRVVLASDPVFMKKRRTIGFSFRRWVNEPPGIEDSLASILDNLALDYELLSMPFTPNDTDAESDTAFHEKIIQRMKNKPVYVSFSNMIEKADLLIGMRLHALITAVNIGKKILAINYDAKIGRILSDLAMEDMIISYDEINKIPLIVREKIFRADSLAQREKVNEALIARICADIRGEPPPKVSVVMPTYNRAHYLREALDSILAQTLHDWELIIIDDGSTDNTKELVESYKDSRIKYYNFGHNGISYSRNIGNLLSRGEIIAVSDSDDVNLPDRLEVTCKEMEKGNADIIYSSMFHFYDTGEKELIPSHPFSHERLREGNFIYHPTVAYRRDAAMRCPYNEELEMVEDYHMYLQAAEKGLKFYQLKEPLVMHRLHKEQVSAIKGKEMEAIHRKIVESSKKAINGPDNSPIVTVIIPTYNRPEMLKDALMSVLSQTYNNFEIIVVNDAGKDIAEVIDSLNSEGKIIYLQHKENRGLPAARNTGLKTAKGRYIAYLDDDDIYYPDHLETLVSFLKTEQDYKVAYTDSNYVFQEWITDRYVTLSKKVLYSQDFDRQRLLVSNYMPVLNVMHRKDLVDKAGLFDEKLGAHEDWDMWLRFSQQCDFYHIKKITAEVRFRTDGTTMTSKDRMPFLKTARIIHKRYSRFVTDEKIVESQNIVEWSLAKEVVARQEKLENSYLVDVSETLFKQKDVHIGNLETHTMNLEAVVKDKDVHIGNLETHASNLETIVKDKGVHIGNLEDMVKEKDAHTGNLEAAVRDREGQIASLDASVKEKEATLNHIYNSRGWRALLVYYKVRDRIFPANSKRRKAAKFIWNLLNKINLKSARLFTKDNIKKLIFYIKNYGVLLFVKKVWSKLNSGKADFSHKPNVPNLNLPVIKEGEDEIISYEDAVVSVVIPTKNAGSDFELLLSILREQKGLKNMEIIAVDSGSSDKTVEIARSYGARIIEIPPEKFSHSYSRNIGAENASGKYIFFTVQDALLPSMLFLYELSSVLKNNDVAAVSCAEFPREDADLFYRVASWYHRRFLNIDGRDRILSMPEVENHMTLRKNGQLSNIACLISREFFMKYKFRNDYAEDLDLGIRLIRDGHKLALLGTTGVIHSHNKPLFYHLKRGYVDSLTLSSIFTDYPVPSICLEDLAGDIIFIWHIINSIITEGFSGMTLPCDIDTFSEIVNKKFSTAINNSYPDSIDIMGNNHIDAEFKSFLNDFVSHYSNNKDKGACKGILVSSVQEFTKIILEHMANIYELVDEYLLEEFKSCIYKAFANQLGAHLAFCYLKDPKSKQVILKSFHDELTKGI